MKFSCRTCRPSPTPQKESTTIQIQSGAIEARQVEQVAGFRCTKAILQEDISKLSSAGKLQRHIPGAAGAVMPVISRCSAVQSTRCRSSSFSERSNATPSEADDAKPPGIQRTEDWIHTCKNERQFFRLQWTATGPGICALHRWPWRPFVSSVVTRLRSYQTWPPHSQSVSVNVRPVTRRKAILDTHGVSSDPTGLAKCRRQPENHVGKISFTWIRRLYA